MKASTVNLIAALVCSPLALMNFYIAFTGDKPFNLVAGFICALGVTVNAVMYRTHKKMGF